MNVVEHLLVIAGEESAELAQAIAKALRFDLEDINPHRNLTARRVIVAEFNDLIAVIEMLQSNDALPSNLIDRAAIDAKKAKVLKWMDYARERGALS